ncbi:sodium channel modifier 1-like [Periplaneta americana]|uniref:sodium channel modifier 1-like n=1 Tax=Periplaneta americana TaxID=6978 RepID=UPI0037E99212
MSFKRDGDDVDLLRSLKHRRVCELLSNHIPDDEALLLKNGRLTCLICSQRPIFDTISMLAIHRKGKKHVNELSKYLLHKRELDLKKLKLDQRRYLRTGLVDEVMGCAPVQQPHKLPYSRGHGMQRKTILSIQTMLKEAEIPGIVMKDNVLPSPSAQVRRYLKGLWKKKPLEKTVEKRRESYPESLVIAPSENYEPESRLKASLETVRAASEDDTVRKKAAEQELKLRMSGWIKNASGSWVKNPDVEFDTDEDEPPISPD